LVFHSSTIKWMLGDSTLRVIDGFQSVSSHMGIKTVLGPNFTLSIKLFWNNICRIAGFSRLVTWYVAVQNINNP